MKYSPVQTSWGNWGALMLICTLFISTQNLVYAADPATSAPTTQPVRDISTPRGVALALFDAIEQKDISTALELCHYAPGKEFAIRTFWNNEIAEQNLYQIACHTFGDTETATFMSKRQPSKELRQQIQKAKETLTADQATLTNSSDSGITSVDLKFIKIDGQWKLNSQELPGREIEVIENLITSGAYNLTAQAITAGKIKTTQEAITAIGEYRKQMETAFGNLKPPAPILALPQK